MITTFYFDSFFWKQKKSRIKDTYLFKNKIDSRLKNLAKLDFLSLKAYSLNRTHVSPICLEQKIKFRRAASQSGTISNFFNLNSFFNTKLPRKTLPIMAQRAKVISLAFNTTHITTHTAHSETMSMEYSLDNYHRSNQDTSLVHKPSVFEGQWVQSGDLLADCSASVGGELALGQNILIAYMPWEGYNFEDAILVSERLVYDDLYTSIHIERYEVDILETKLGVEEITRDIPDVPEESLKHLHRSGIAKLGAYIQEGDILVGKVMPVNKKNQSNYQKLLYTILEKTVLPVRDSSLRAPKGIKAKVVGIQIFKNNTITPIKENLTSAAGQNRTVKTKFPALRTKFNGNIAQPAKKPGIIKSSFGLNFDALRDSKADKSPKAPEQNQATSKNFFKVYTQNNSSISSVSLELPCLESTTNKNTPLKIANQTHINSYKNKYPLLAKAGALHRYPKEKSPSHLRLKKSSFARFLSLELKKYSSFHYSEMASARLKSLKKAAQHVESVGYLGTQSLNRSKKEKNLLNGVSSVQIYLAEKRRIQVGDKMAGRHGNKGIISQILPPEDMPFLPDGTPLDMVLNPLGVPSRMNVGQIFECLLGLAGKHLGENFKVFPFDEIYGPEASRSFVYSKLYNARVKTGKLWLFNPNSPGKIRLYDGRTGESFDQAVTVGYAYMLRLVHMVDDKIHARSTGPYSLVTQQPLRGRSKQGGQRLGEMEVWALEGYGAAFTLLEMLTIKSDDMTGRMTLWSNLILNKEISIGTPESFKVLICELQALCLDIGLFRVNSKN